jgi:hypothetical protein
MDPNWSRWIFSSTSQYFKTRLNSEIAFFVEGEDQGINNLKNYVEFRLNGPNIYTLSGYYKLHLTINILVCVNQDSKNILGIHRYSGLVASTFPKAIPIYNYDTDPPTFVGCLQLTRKDKREVDISHIGQLTPDMKQMQAIVQAPYVMYLEIGDSYGTN